jgi:hypothetical protein
MKEKKILRFLITILFAFYGHNLRSQVYIDPTFTGDPQGTLSNPYTTFPIFENNTTYLLKCGTTLTTSSTVIIDADNVIIGAYDSGEKPKIYNPDSTRRSITIMGNNCNLIGISSEMPKAPDYNTGEYNIALYNSENKNISAIIQDCNIKGGNPAINGYKSTALRVIDCNITHACYDSYYGEFVDTVIFKRTTISDMDYDTSDLSQDLIHAKHFHRLYVDSCVLNHDFPGKYCIIGHQDDPGFETTRMEVTNSRLIGSEETQACVKASVPFNIFKNCIFSGGMRSMQDVWSNLEVDNCLFLSSGPGMIQGIPWCDYPSIKNSTFIGIPNPYLGDSSTQNCIFWQCSGGGDSWANSVIDPLFDTNYNATAPSLVGVGYVSGGVVSGLAEATKVGTLHIYPNPANDVINVQTSGRANVRIFDISGRLQLSRVVEKEGRIPLNLESGIYIVQIVNEIGNINTRKLLVIK